MLNSITGSQAGRVLARPTLIYIALLASACSSVEQEAPTGREVGIARAADAPPIESASTNDGAGNGAAPIAGQSDAMGAGASAAPVPRPGDEGGSSGKGCNANDDLFGPCDVEGGNGYEWCQHLPEWDWSVCSRICPDRACPEVPGFEVQCLLPAPYPWNEHCAIMCPDDVCPEGMECRQFEAGSVCVWPRPPVPPG